MGRIATQIPGRVESENAIACLKPLFANLLSQSSPSEPPTSSLGAFLGIRMRAWGIDRVSTRPSGNPSVFAKRSVFAKFENAWRRRFLSQVTSSKRLAKMNERLRQARAHRGPWRRRFRPGNPRSFPGSFSKRLRISRTSVATLLSRRHDPKWRCVTRRL